MTTLIECSINFYGEKEVAVSSSTSNEHSIDFLAIFLFISYTFRQVINIGIDHPVCVALGKTLSEITDGSKPRTFAVVPTNVSITRNKTNLQYISIDDINFLAPGKEGNKRFSARLVEEKGITNFLLEPKGFGFLGEGITYYAPISVGVLLYYFISQQIDLRKLAVAAEVCGLAITSNLVTMENQFNLAYKYTKKIIIGE